MNGDSVPSHIPFAGLAAADDEIATLYRELRQPLLTYLVCLGLSADEAQDVVQDAFLTLHQHVTAGVSKGRVRAWIFRVAHNRARNRQKRHDSRFAVPLDAWKDVSHKVTPELGAIAKERFVRLGRAIRSLPERERECLLLRAEGLRYREIGDVLDLPTSTVAVLVSRAIRTLAEQCDV